jgi:hypothetical protein
LKTAQSAVPELSPRRRQVVVFPAPLIDHRFISEQMLFLLA